MPTAEQAPAQNVERLWQTSRYIPQSVRLLGTRYRSLFLTHARQCEPEGALAPVADALSFLEYMLRQNQLALLDLERKALHDDRRRLRRRFKLSRGEGGMVSARERWKILQWLHL